MVDNGNTISKETAERLHNVLQSAISALNDAVEIANADCDKDFGASLKRGLAEAMATIGWDILEGSIYVHYPELRPYALTRDEGKRD